jgi:hypothetical protein
MDDNKDSVVLDPAQPDADKAPVIDPKEDKGTPVNPPSKDEENLNKVIAARDKNFEKAKTAEEKIADLEARQDFLEAEKEKNSYIDVIAKKNNFSEKEKAILSEATSPDQADKLADTLISYREDAKTAALEELQNVGTGTPRLDPDTINARLKELEGTGRVEEMIELKRQL